jgi:cell division protein FtsI/penicillin-binding protein 2
MRGMGATARPIAALILALAVAVACSAPAPDSTAYPTPVPTPPLTLADDTARAFLAAWRIRTYEPMYDMLAASDRQRMSRDEFVALLESFEQLTGVKRMRWAVGATIPTSLPPEARPPDQPAPSRAPPASGSPSAQPLPLPVTASPEPTPSSSAGPSPTPIAPDAPLDGPVPAVRIPVELHFGTDLFGEVDLNRHLILVQGAAGWQIRWSPEVLFPELADGRQLALTQQDSPRGRIVSVDGTVFAQNRADGKRVYPQEWLAGQTIGWVGDISAEELKSLSSQGYRAGDLIGRGGLELGAEALLRGEPGFTLSVVQPGGGEGVPVLERPMIPGRDVVISLRARIQATAETAIGGYAEAGTAVVDPRSGDVWALASAPLFNPNSMTIGTTLGGRSLGTPSASARLNHATMGAYPTGSSFKVFTLGAALKAGVASPATRMTCNGTWTFSGFTFRNYLEHHLPGFVSLLQAMAFSCNTTYMPLSIMVYEANHEALTDLVAEFGFGRLSGIQHLPEATGILPDRHYFEVTKRWNDAFSPYGPFDQIQLAIGQGDLLATPLQMANAFAAFGNGGTLWVPRIVVETRSAGGTVTPFPGQRARQVSLSAAQLDYVVESMKAVVNLPYGTARAAFAGFGIQVAGKSGTAETGGPNPNAWFPAFAPADDPRISVATVLVRVPLATGGSDAAPLVRRVMARYFTDQ